MMGRMENNQNCKSFFATKHKLAIFPQNDSFFSICTCALVVYKPLPDSERFIFIHLVSVYGIKIITFTCITFCDCCVFIVCINFWSYAAITLNGTIYITHIKVFWSLPVLFNIKTHTYIEKIVFWTIKRYPDFSLMWHVIHLSLLTAVLEMYGFPFDILIINWS